MVRISALFGGLVLAVAALLAPAAAGAAPAPGLTVTGSATAPDNGGSGVDVAFRIVVAGGPATSSMLTITSPASAPLLASTLTVDGKPAAAGTVTPTGRVTVVRLGSGASAATGGRLTNGTHTVTYLGPAKNVRRGDAVSAVASASEGGAPVSAASGDVAIPLADLTLASAFRGAATQDLGTGQQAPFLLHLGDRGSAVTRSSLTFTFPEHLSLDGEFGVARFDENADYSDDPDGSDDELSCRTAGRTTTCDLGALDRPTDAILFFAVTSDASAPVSGSTQFSVAATPTSGDEADARDNTTTGTVRFTGTSHLSTSTHAARTTVPVGEKTSVTITVHNSGPQPAAGTISLIGVVDSLTSDSERSTHFRVTHFSGKQFDDSGPDDGVGGGGIVITGGRRLDTARSALRTYGRLMHVRRDAADDDPEPTVWNTGTIAPGQTVSATLTVKAVKVGKGNVAAVALASNDPTPYSCVDPSGDFDAPPTHAQCPFLDTVALHAVAARDTAGNGDEPIAATGTPDGQLTVLGSLAVVLGVALMRFGRLRRGRHRA